MKNLLLLLCSFSSLYVSAQEVIVEEKFKSGDKPIDFEVLEKQNVILVKKGKSYGSLRGINKVEEYSLDRSRKLLVDNVKFLDFSPSIIDNTFSATEFNGVGWVTNTQLYEGGNLFATIDKDKPRVLCSRDYTYSVGSQKNKVVEALEKEDIFLNRLTIAKNKVESFKLNKPDFLSVNKKAFYKLKEIKHKVFFHKESFDITTKFINSDVQSFILHRAVYNYEGKNVKNISYSASIGKPLIYSNNGGGSYGYDDFSKANKFDDQLSVNNFYIDTKTNVVYIYGLYGKKEESLEGNEIGGYYIIKFDADGKKLWQKSEELNNEVFKNRLTKTRVYTRMAIDNGSIKLSLLDYSFEKYFFYSLIDSSTGNHLKSKLVPFAVDKMFVSELSNTEIVSFFTLKEYKDLIFDDNTFFSLNENEKVKEYLSTFASSKKKISFNSQRSDKGVWLIESDNKTYYKVLYFSN